jgi:hypothetical protein
MGLALFGNPVKAKRGGERYFQVERGAREYRAGSRRIDFQSHMYDVGK